MIRCAVKDDGSIVGGEVAATADDVGRQGGAEAFVVAAADFQGAKDAGEGNIWGMRV